MTLCEVRVPTFRRPRLLDRALRSLLAQTHADWRCVVFDDCPDGSAKSVVDAIGDERIEYRRNPSPLRAIGNIDQCFRNRPYAGGEFAAVLEDDNYWLPEHLEAQLEICRMHEVSVAFSAQRIEEIIEPGQPGRLGEDKTIAWIYPEGRRRWREMLPAVLFSHAFSNGAVFWRLGCETDFEIGSVTRRPGIQETLRVLKLRNDVFVSHRTTSVWRSNDPRDSYVSQTAETRGLKKLFALWGTFAERREVSDYRVWYLYRFGVADALDFWRRTGPDHMSQIERSLLLSGRYVKMTEKPTSWRLSQLMRGHAFRILVKRQLDMRSMNYSFADE